MIEEEDELSDVRACVSGLKAANEGIEILKERLNNPAAIITHADAERRISIINDRIKQVKLFFQDR
jgi:hypothetical protein